MLSLKKKEKIVNNLQEKFKISLSTVIASINGITSNSINQLRKEAREIGVIVQVVSNSLLRKAVVQTSCACLSKFFIGNNVIAFSTKKPSDAARIFVKFSKIHETFKIKGAFFENKLIKLDQVNILANLPDYEESLIRLMTVLKVGSVSRLINVLKNFSNCKKVI